MSDKYTPIYVELDDRVVRDAIEKLLNPEMLRTRFVSRLVRMDRDKWIVKLDYSLVKDMKSNPG